MFFRHCSSYSFCARGTNGFWVHTSPAEFGQQLPDRQDQDHKSKQTVRSSAKTKSYDGKKKKAVYTCVCVTSHMERERSVCTSVFMSMFDTEFLRWLGSFGCLQSFGVSPLVASVWSPVSPRKKLQVKQKIGETAHRWGINCWNDKAVRLSDRLCMCRHKWSTSRCAQCTGWHM